MNFPTMPYMGGGNGAGAMNSSSIFNAIMPMGDDFSGLNFDKMMPGGDAGQGGGAGKKTTPGATYSGHGFWGSGGVDSAPQAGMFYGTGAAGKGGQQNPMFSATMPWSSYAPAGQSGFAGYNPSGYAGSMPGSFSANGPSSGGITGGGGGGNNVASGQGYFNMPWTDKSWSSIFGASGNDLANFLKNGAGFNPQIAQSFANFMEPERQRAVQQQVDMFGDEGLRFSSTAALGIADTNDRFNRDIMEEYAKMQEKATDRYMQTLLSLAPYEMSDRAADGGGFNFMQMGQEAASMAMMFM